MEEKRRQKGKRKGEKKKKGQKKRQGIEKKQENKLSKKCQQQFRKLK